MGRTLTWDSDAWDAWYAAREAAPGVPEGLLSRDGLAAAYGVSRHALKELWAAREDNGHPEPALTHGKALYWDAAAWDAWYRALPSGDEGEPSELVTLAEAGRLLGLSSGSVTVYASRPPKGWPEPVEEVALGGGRVRRLYRRADVLAYRASRTR
ncbi:hypothetical protein [Actinocorallia sp. A-T 12471]|uniref:hypothetical protein n=1 Tax=Actinocorallia sp. A-T 12471 TaxID=3089813 RepID=UPI0029D08447|nr:hypothetical protein [Actinocorallia sp. A-T 12471]MDX6742491.1 hypothetical protein [Actinocorallia sp. A-T 12471]